MSVDTLSERARTPFTAAERREIATRTLTTCEYCQSARLQVEVFFSLLVPRASVVSYVCEQCCRRTFGVILQK